MKKYIMLSLLFLVQTAHAQFWDGNKLYGWLNDSQQRTYGILYVGGVADAEYSLRMRSSLLSMAAGQADLMPHFCIPDNATTGQVADVVKVYLEKNPQVRHERASDLVYESLKATWPCPQNKLHVTLGSMFGG